MICISEGEIIPTGFSYMPAHKILFLVIKLGKRVHRWRVRYRDSMKCCSCGYDNYKEA